MTTQMFLGFFWLHTPHLKFSLWLKLSIGERQQRLQHHLLSDQTVHVGSVGRPLQGKQQTPSHHQALREDTGALVERLADAARVIVQQAPVKLGGGRDQCNGFLNTTLGSMDLLLDYSSKLRVLTLEEEEEKKRMEISSISANPPQLWKWT